MDYWNAFFAERLPVKIETAEESIFWGVRWLYNKAQKQYGAGDGDSPPYVREWKTWKQAVIDYNGSLQKYEYQKKIWDIYKNGIDPDGNPLVKLRIRKRFIYKGKTNTIQLLNLDIKLCLELTKQQTQI